MRSIILICITALILSCNENSASSSEPPGDSGLLLIEVEHHFDNNVVQVALDGKTIISKKMTTNYSISLAWSTFKEYNINSTHRIDVALPHKHTSNSLTFTMQDTLSIFIRYRPKENKIEFDTADLVIIRD